MLAGFLLGILHDRRLMREAQVNLAIRWFAGFGLQDRLPDHSSLTRIRQRWGAERFRRIFERTVRVCIAAKIAKSEIVHVDASLIRAYVAWDGLAERHVEAVAEANDDGSGDGGTARRSKKTGRLKKVCLTDPDASPATSGRNRRLKPSYKQHGVVDDVSGVVLDVEVTTGEINEGQEILARLDAVAATTGAPIGTVTADAGYAYGMAQAVKDLVEQGSPAFEAAVPILSQLLKAEVAEREVRSIAYHLKAVRFPANKDLAGFDFADSEINEALVRQLHR
jgi:IS5 family transposase